MRGADSEIARLQSYGGDGASTRTSDPPARTAARSRDGFERAGKENYASGPRVRTDVTRVRNGYSSGIQSPDDACTGFGSQVDPQ